jgi:hypothetical protein
MDDINLEDHNGLLKSASLKQAELRHDQKAINGT